MENIKPPPNASPEEIQAWNNMMDTMVTFIQASTHLMNTITQKVRVSSAIAKTKKGGDEICEPECTICAPKPLKGPCGICDVTELTPKKGSSSAVVPSASVQKPPKPSKAPCGICDVTESKPKKGSSSAVVSSASVQKPPKVKSSTREVVPPIKEEPPEPEDTFEEAQEDPTEETQGGEDGEDPAEEGATEDAPAEEDAADEEQAEEGPTEEAPAAEKRGSQVKEVFSQKESQQSKQQLDKTLKSASKVISPEGGDKEGCVCAAIRAKKGREKCGCKKKKGEEEELGEDEKEEEPVERLCACGSTTGAIQDMMQKLACAQNEITQMHEELGRLQRMDATKRMGPHAGPNPAALYREIMRDSVFATPQGAPPSSRQEPFRGCQPCIDAYQGSPSPNQAPPRPIPPNVRQRQFQSESSANNGYPTQGSLARQTPPPYYPGCQAPCRRTPTPATPTYGARGTPYSPASPQQNSNYWNRLGQFGSPNEPTIERIVCPMARNRPVEETPPPRRRIICGLSPVSGAPQQSGDCDPDCSNISM